MHAFSEMMEEACGIFGVHAPGLDVSRLAFFGLQALQHRGQEGAGIAVADAAGVVCAKNTGLVREVFDEGLLRGMRGHAAVGHVRYSSDSGTMAYRSLQPHAALRGASSLAAARTGMLTNAEELLADLRMRTAVDEVVSDSELAVQLLAAYCSEEDSKLAAICRLMGKMKGAFSMAIVDNERLYAFRDAHGIRPLCIGAFPHGRGWVVASESCAFDIMGAEYLREVRAGELVWFDDEGIHSESVLEPLRHAACIFEYVYYARPDSMIDGANVHRAREAFGRALFHEAPVEADIVIGVPDSGTSAAIGYARESGIFYTEGLIKNRFADRSFVRPPREIGELGVRVALNPLPCSVRNRRVVVLDDSIVRGEASRQLVTLLREAGASEVHVRIASPALAWPCFMHLDNCPQDCLAAALGGVDEIRDYLGADSLAFLSFEGLKSCIHAQTPGFCTACFDGRYPIEEPARYPENAFSRFREPVWEA